MLMRMWTYSHDNMRNISVISLLLLSLSRQHEMTRAIGAKNDESRSRTRTRSQI